jgi:TorA maturation chaperone TorD
MSSDPDTALELARECVYRFLSAALSDPCGVRFRLVLDPVAQRLSCQAADLLREEAGAAPGRLGLGELPPEALTLHALVAQVREHFGAVQADHKRVFGLIARECPPYETEYHPNAEPFFRAQQMADVAGFYRAFGLEPSLDTPERPDHVALELEFLAFVLLKKRLALAAAAEDPAAAEHAGVCAEAERDFFRDHLAWWLPAFATALRRQAGGGFYAAVGTALAALVASERRRLGVDTPSVAARPDAGEPPEEPEACAGCAARG